MDRNSVERFIKNTQIYKELSQSVQPFLKPQLLPNKQAVICVKEIAPIDFINMDMDTQPHMMCIWVDWLQKISEISSTWVTFESKGRS